MCAVARIVAVTVSALSVLRRVVPFALQSSPNRTPGCTWWFDHWLSARTTCRIRHIHTQAGCRLHKSAAPIAVSRLGRLLTRLAHCLFLGGFRVVVLLAQALPVRFVPKQLHVALVGNDMVGCVCGRNYSGLQALCAKRVLASVGNRLFLPLPSVEFVVVRVAVRGPAWPLGCATVGAWLPGRGYCPAFRASLGVTHIRVLLSYRTQSPRQSTPA